MKNIHLSDNKGYRWHSGNGVWAKGYLFDEKDVLWSNESLPGYFASCYDQDAFYDKLVKSNGLFSVIVKRDGLLMAGVDRVRMFPLFYKIQGNNLHISDKPEVSGTKPLDLNPLSVAEFFATGYVTGRHLLLNNFYQIEAGQMVIADNHNIKTRWYHHMIPDKDNIYKTESSPEFQLSGVIERMFFRAGKAAGERTIAIPLSGGFDSRLIAIMMKELGFDNVICFTYGRKNNREAEISEKTARKLGYKWFFVEYNPKTCGYYLQDEDFLNYVLYSSKYCSMPFLQDYFAIKHLSKQKIIDDNSVIMPGHSGDVTAGSRLVEELQYQCDAKKLTNLIYKNNYNLVKPSETVKNKLKRKIHSQIVSFVNDNKKSSHIYQNWDMKERQAKFINNSTNVISWFGYEHYLPFWDVEFIDFFTCLEFRQKLYKDLYNKFLIDRYFKTYGLFFDRELYAKPADYRFREIKSRLKFIVPGSVLRKRLRLTDWQYYCELTGDMEAELRKNNIRYSKPISGFNEIIVQWFVYHLKKQGGIWSAG